MALLLGGIATGTVLIGGRGDLCDFEMVNRLLKGVTPADCLLALWTRDGTGRVAYRILEGLRVFRDVRACYDGERRNPFDEAECGHHYVRATASWAAGERLEVELAARS